VALQGLVKFDESSTVAGKTVLQPHFANLAMHFTHLILALWVYCCLSVAVVSSPTRQNANPASAALYKRTGIFTGRGIYVCSEKGWKGNCQWREVDFETEYNKCISITNKGGITGFGPDKSLWVAVFADAGCAHMMIPVLGFPGYSSIKAWGVDTTKETVWVIVTDLAVGSAT
jgi:hypothetical protein